MFSSNLKRSVATLGVVAGLLAAAVPASAGPGSSEVFELNVKAPTKALNTNAGNDTLVRTPKATAKAKSKSKYQAPSPKSWTWEIDG
jgi:hypothetical protein